jgi:cell division protein FtsI (penicillin-binding protein 3)
MTEDIKKDILWRMYLVYLGIFLLALAIVGKAAYIQFAEGPELIQKSEKQEIRVFDLEANRGNIYDAGGNLLATSVPIFEIRMDAANTNIHDAYFNENIDALAQNLSDLFGNKSKYQYKKGISDARKNGNRYYLIKRKVSYEDLKKLRTFPIFDRGRFRGGLIVNQHTRREMPFDELAKRTIGYQKKAEDIFVGLEGAYNAYLEGKDGKQIMRRVSNNEWIPDYSKEKVEM